MEDKELNSSEVDSIKILMDLGLKEVSNRTFIHESELKRFLSGDFENINKTKAMGFIQILQREFHIDLTPLKNKYLEYASEHKENEPKIKESMIVEEVKSEERKKSFFSILFLLLAIGSIVYLVNKFDLLNFKKPVEVATAVEKKQNDSKEVNLNQLNSTNDNQKVDDSKDNENKIEISKVLEENKEASEQAGESENNNQQNVDLSQLNNGNSNDENINQTLVSTVSTEQNSTESDENSIQTPAVTNELYITPRLKVWIGTIEIDSLKKHDFLAKKGDRVDIDTSKDQLIMIGHKFVDIYLNGEKVKFKRKGPIRFKYIDGKLEEINRREFNSLAKGRQW